jgi:hypothetical protein
LLVAGVVVLLRRCRPGISCCAVDRIRRNSLMSCLVPFCFDSSLLAVFSALCICNEIRPYCCHDISNFKFDNSVSFMYFYTNRLDQICKGKLLRNNHTIIARAYFLSACFRQTITSCFGGRFVEVFFRDVHYHPHILRPILLAIKKLLSVIIIIT